ncbi:ion channel POLLUX [Raphidocelis subcapitata]|uniref:Ion channel POLLUX n=1 Tax=Raphidocelis subcapitata TaxID=307507 RepID=A0A2V0PD77_9CHLO|nr:ion channel POLLUX [Raphidocelis subcapitata]|eukprot:GBF95117.1 ion channel POLLUX [Raphidocelis subcapitata]
MPAGLAAPGAPRRAALARPPRRGASALRVLAVARPRQSGGDGAPPSASAQQQAPAHALLRRLPVAALAGAALALAASHGSRALAAAPPPPAAPAAEALEAAPMRRAVAPATLSLGAGPGQGLQLPTAAETKYRVLQLFAMPTVGKLMAVLAVAVPVVLAGGFAYKRAMGVPWGQALTKAYHVMGNCPGIDITQEEKTSGLLISNAVYLAGMLGFAAVLGIIIDDISSAVAEVRHGNFPIAERGHTVVLGWNRQTLPTLRQIALAQAQAGDARPFGMPVVVLADRDKMEMDREVLEALGTSLPVITRSGSGARLEDLRRAAAAAASAVLLQYPDSADADAAAAEQAAALAALKREGGPYGQKIIVQGSYTPGDDDADPTAVALAAARGGGGVGPGAGAAELVMTNGERRLSQLMAQVALQPGLEYVLGDLLEFEDDYRGAEFYMAPVTPDLAGRPFKEVRRAFSTGVVVGFMERGPGGALRLNPRDGDAVPAGSNLVFVAAGQSVERAEAPVETSLPRLRRPRGGQLRRRHIAVLCFERDPAPILAAIADFAPRGSRVTLVCSDPNAKEALKVLSRRGIKAEAVAGSPASGAALRAARLERADTAVVWGAGSSPAGGDAQAVSTVLQLQSFAARHLEAGRRSTSLDVVVCVNSTSTEEVLWHATLSHEAEQAAAAAAARAADAAAGGAARRGARDPADTPAALQLHMLNPDQLMAGIVTQAAIEPRLNRVIAELFTNDRGHEIYLKRASCFGLPPAGAKPSELSWSQVQEAVRARGQTAVGLAPIAGGPDAIVLAPAADERFVLEEGDEIIVVAKDYR